MEFDLCMVFDGVLMQDNCKPNADKDLNNIPNIYICVSDQFTKRLNSTYVTAIKYYQYLKTSDSKRTLLYFIINISLDLDNLDLVFKLRGMLGTLNEL